VGLAGLYTPQQVERFSGKTEIMCSRSRARSWAPVSCGQTACEEVHFRRYTKWIRRWNGRKLRNATRQADCGRRGTINDRPTTKRRATEQGMAHLKLVKSPKSTTSALRLGPDGEAYRRRIIAKSIHPAYQRRPVLARHKQFDGAIIRKRVANAKAAELRLD